MSKRLSNKKLRLMISSRCKDEIVFQGKKQPLSILRKELQKIIEAELFFGKSMIEVYLNDTEVPGNDNAWENCLREVRKSDLFISLINGKAGHQGSNKGIGLCQAELMEALNNGNEKVRVVYIEHKSSDADKLFIDYLDSQHLDISMKAKTGEEVIEQVKLLLPEMIVSLSGKGRSNKRADFGSILEWSKMSFDNRASQITNTIYKYLGTKKAKEDWIIKTIDKEEYLFKVSAIPGPFSSSKDKAGRPFVKDHELHKKVKNQKVFGPIHIIGCHRTVTESQALKVLGFEDSIAVTSDFGIFVCDPINKVQIAFISNCKDSSTSELNTKRFFDWLDRSEELEEVLKTAKLRSKVLQVLSSL